jgi:hypothetical protein
MKRLFTYQRSVEGASIGRGDTLISSMSYRMGLMVFDTIRLIWMLHRLLRGSGTGVVQVSPMSMTPMLQIRNLANGNRLLVRGLQLTKQSPSSCPAQGEQGARISLCCVLHC